MVSIKNFLKALFTWYLSLQPLAKGFIMMVTTYFFLGLLFLAVRFTINEKAKEVMVPYNQSNTFISDFVSKTNVPELGKSTYTKVFNLQNEILTLRRTHHNEMALGFLKNYMAVLTCLIVISCIGGLLLFILINNGWAKSSSSVKGLFLSLASAAVCFSLFSGVFDQQKNFEDNMLRFMNYTKADMSLARQLSELSKISFPKRQVSKKYLDLNFKPAKPLTAADSVFITDTAGYYNKLDTMVAKNTETINNFTDYVLTIDASKMRNIGDIYQSLLALKNMGRSDSLPK